VLILLSKVFRGLLQISCLSATVSSVVLYQAYYSKLGLILPQLREIAELHLTSFSLCSLEALSKQGAVLRGLTLFPFCQGLSPIPAIVLCLFHVLFFFLFLLLLLFFRQEGKSGSCYSVLAGSRSLFDWSKASDFMSK